MVSSGGVEPVKLGRLNGSRGLKVWSLGAWMSINVACKAISSRSRVKLGYDVTKCCYKCSGLRAETIVAAAEEFGSGARTWR